MLPLLSLHSLVAHRGDGLRPELRALLLSRVRCGDGLTATIEFESEKTGAPDANAIPEPETPRHP